MTTKKEVEAQLKALQKDMDGTLKILAEAYKKRDYWCGKYGDLHDQLLDTEMQLKEAQEGRDWYKHLYEMKMTELQEEREKHRENDMRSDPMFVTALEVIRSNHQPTTNDVFFVKNALKKYPAYFKKNKEFGDWVVRSKEQIFYAMDLLSEMNRK